MKAKFDSDYVAAYKENKTEFDTVMADITEPFWSAVTYWYNRVLKPG